MQKGFISAYYLGMIEMLGKIERHAADADGLAANDIDTAFLAAAFQAGVDQFLIPDVTGHVRPSSKFARDRTKILNRERSPPPLLAMKCSDHVGPAWNDIANNELRRTVYFIDSLTESMRAGAAALTIGGVPSGNVDLNPLPPAFRLRADPESS